MRKRTFTQQEEQDIVKYYLTPFSLSETSLHFQTYRNRVKEILDKYHIELHSKELNKQAKLSKTRKTNIEKYGVENTFQSAVAKHNRDSFYQDKDKVNQAIKKNRATKLKNHGSENYNNTSKMQATRLAKYGVVNFFQNKDIHEKALSNAKSDQAKEKKKKTCLDRFGVEYSLSAQEVREEIKNTCLVKYGKPYAVLNEEQLKKKLNTSISTVRQKYGVDFPCQTPNCISSCGSSDSKPNKEFANILKENRILFTREFPLERKLYDFKVDNVLIEINPSATHNINWGIRSDKGLSKDYHLNKTLLAKNNGYRCIHVFDWDDKNKIVNLLKDKETIYARKCHIKAVSKEEEKTFLNTYHLQGYVKSKICLGLYYNDCLVSLMSFGTPRYNKKCNFELLRYCVCDRYLIIGGAEKLFNRFVENNKNKSIISYCDFSKFDGGVYDRLGFELVRVSEPRCHWYNIKTKQHITDNLLLQRGFDQLFGANYGKGTSNEQLMLSHGFVQVFDCGQGSYIFWQ